MHPRVQRSLSITDPVHIARSLREDTTSLTDLTRLRFIMMPLHHLVFLGAVRVPREGNLGLRESRPHLFRTSCPPSRKSDMYPWSRQDQVGECHIHGNERLWMFSRALHIGQKRKHGFILHGHSRAPNFQITKFGYIVWTWSILPVPIKYPQRFNFLYEIHVDWLWRHTEDFKGQQDWSGVFFFFIWYANGVFLRRKKIKTASEKSWGSLSWISLCWVRTPQCCIQSPSWAHHPCCRKHTAHAFGIWIESRRSLAIGIFLFGQKFCC